jgi:hypothetical protein
LVQSELIIRKAICLGSRRWGLRCWIGWRMLRNALMWINTCDKLSLHQRPLFHFFI